MADLSDEELAREFAISYPSGDIRRMALELQRRRAEQAAGREHIQHACEKAIDGALGELARQAGYPSDLRMLKEARGAGLLAVAHLIEGKALTAQEEAAEQAAGRSHVERVVREIAYHEAAGHDCIGGSTLNRVSDAIARRVADRLSVPVLRSR